MAQANEQTFAVETTRLTKVYRGRQIALNDVSLSVEKGCILGLLGANGAGKTTLLRLLLGLHSPTSGMVKVFGQRMTPNAGSLRRRIGYIPTHPRFGSGFTPMSYLDHVGQLQRLPKSVRKPRVAAWLRACGLQEASGDRIEGFSEGMLARLAVAASLINEPDLLLWDEPMHGLDLEARRSMFELIRTLGEERTLIIASHHLNDIDATCDRVALMVGGHLAFHGTLAEFRGREGKGTTRFEIDLDGDSKALQKLGQTVKNIQELQFGEVDAGRLIVQVKDAGLNAPALANVFLAVADAKLGISGVRSLGAASETAFLRLVAREESRGFARLYQDREAA
jgi:ABC-2 type transport system ATP-binding protein